MDKYFCKSLGRKVYCSNIVRVSYDFVVAIVFDSKSCEWLEVNLRDMIPLDVYEFNLRCRANNRITPKQIDNGFFKKEIFICSDEKEYDNYDLAFLHEEYLIGKEDESTLIGGYVHKID